MSGEIIDNGGTAIPKMAAERVATDPYIRHVVELINSGKFTEPLALASLREELLEQMADMITDEESYGAYWA